MKLAKLMQFLRKAGRKEKVDPADYDVVGEHTMQTWVPKRGFEIRLEESEYDDIDSRSHSISRPRVQKIEMLTSNKTGEVALVVITADDEVLEDINSVDDLLDIVDGVYQVRKVA